MVLGSHLKLCMTESDFNFFKKCHPTPPPPPPPKKRFFNVIWKKLTLISSEYAYHEKLILCSPEQHTLSTYRWYLNPSTIASVAFISIWVFFHEHPRFTGQQRKGGAISLTPLYHFHSLHRHLVINQTITDDYRKQPDLNWESLVSKRKSLTTNEEGQSKDAKSVAVLCVSSLTILCWSKKNITFC